MTQAETLARRGRPDDVRRALLQAAVELNTPAHSPTLREIVRHARVGNSAGRSAIHHMRRAGLLVIAGDRRVAYRNRPVAEYAPACPVQAPIRGFDFAGLCAAW